MNTHDILNLILETLASQEKKITRLEKTLSETLSEQDRLNSAYSNTIENNLFSINDLEVRIVSTEDSIFNIENIDIEDELRNSCAFTELEEKVLELEEPQGFISDIGNKSFIESNREELDELKERIIEIEELMEILKEEDTVNGKDMMNKLCEFYRFLKG
jgi:hypothetical protein